MTTVDELFVDTNVLIYATDTLSPWYRPARVALEQARRQRSHLVFSPQIIREYLSAATRISVRTGSPPLSQIIQAVRSFQAMFRLLDENEAVVTALLSLVQTVPVAGKQVHDANIVATMQVHGIRRLLTHNTGDFARFAGLITVVSLV